MKANHTAVNESFRKNDKAMVAGALGACIALLVSILVGVLVYYKLSASTYQALNPQADASAYGKLARAQVNTTNITANTSFTLAPIIAIVLIAGIILAIVTRFGTGGGM